MSEKAEEKPSNVIDVTDPARNMYGCAPCPKCESVYRAPFWVGTDAVIECDECGFKEYGAEVQP